MALYYPQVTHNIGGNTSGATAHISSGTYFLAGGNNITLSQNANSVTISAFNQTSPNIPVVGAAIQDVGTATGSGTATSQFAAHDHVHRGQVGWDVNGVASTFYGTQQLSAGNLMSIATGGNTTRGSAQFINLLSSATTASRVESINVVGAMASRFALEGHQHAGLHAISVGGNTTGATSAGAGSFMLAGGNNITLSGATAAGGMTLTISQQQVTIQHWQPHYNFGFQAGQQTNGSMYMWPVTALHHVTATRAHMMVSLSLSTSTNSSHAGNISLSLGVYTRSGSTLNLGTSASQTYQWSNTSDGSASLLSGLRILSVPLGVNLTPGEYWCAVWSATSTTNANWFSASMVQMQGITGQLSGMLLLSSNSSYQQVPGFGYYSNASFTTAMPASAHITDIKGGFQNNNQKVPWIAFLNSTY